MQPADASAQAPAHAQGYKSATRLVQEAVGGKFSEVAAAFNREDNGAPRNGKKEALFGISE